MGVGQPGRGQQRGAGDHQGAQQRRVAGEGVKMPGDLEGKDRVPGVVGVQEGAVKGVGLQAGGMRRITPIPARAGRPARGGRW